MYFSLSLSAPLPPLPFPSQVEEGVTSVGEELQKYDRKYKYEELRGKQCPAGVDPSKKEVRGHRMSGHV